MNLPVASVETSCYDVHMMSHDEARWGRLAADLAAAGVEVRVDAKRFPGGRSHSITIRLDDRSLVTVIDQWWRKNMDVWTGWTVFREGVDSIVQSSVRGLKKRSEVVAAVRRAQGGA